MATRCNVLVKKEDGSVLQFYRHWDGYVENGTGDELESLVKDYTTEEGFFEEFHRGKMYKQERHFKVHGDAEYIYYVNLQAKKVTYRKVYGPSKWDYDFPKHT